MESSVYRNPKIYEILFKSNNEEEKNFYIRKAKKSKGKSLYVGTGEGRIIIPMIEEGINVIGIDNSKEMLSRLKEKINDPEDRELFFNMDLLNFKFSFKFDLIILPARVFCHILHREDQKKVLLNIYNHLNNDGKLILNYFSPSSDGGILSIQNKKVFYKKVEYIDDTYVVWTLNKKDPFTQNYERYFFIDVFNSSNVKKEEYYFMNKLRYTYVSEFENMLEMTSFKNIKKYGDFNESEYNRNSKEVIWEANK